MLKNAIIKRILCTFCAIISMPENGLKRGLKTMEKIRGEYIKLDSFLKLCDVVSTGGEAKLLINSEEVKVNGAVETRRGRKLHPGDQVEVHGRTYTVE